MRGMKRMFCFCFFNFVVGLCGLALYAQNEQPKPVKSDEGPVTILAGAEWLPLDVELDIEAGSALDFSAVIPRHAPAGKFGRVIVSPQAKFAFEKQPKTPSRFYGVNLCYGAHYLSKEQADRLAERLMRLGYNAVRVHHYEEELVDRSKGDSLTLRPDKLDQLDYLFAAFKQRGIYITTDLFVSRRVFSAEIWPGEKGDVSMDDFKAAVLVNDRAFANYKAFTRALLSHKNPYTGLTWSEDPTLAWLNLVNEGNAGNFIGRLKGKLREDWQRAWNHWLAVRYPDREALKIALGKLEDDQDTAKGNVPMPTTLGGSSVSTLLSVFLAETEMDFFRRTRAFLRDELGCKALLSNDNAWTNPVQMQAHRAEMDYVDDHFYVDHPQFLQGDWRLPSRCPNTSPISGGAAGGRGCAFTRLLDKPFTITEYNYSSPGRFRGVGGILTGALGAVQDWSGIWRFAYSHDRRNLFNPSPINYFDMANDPLGQAAERASLCLFLRGDLAPAKHSVAIAVTQEELLKTPKSARDKTPPWQSLAWITRVGWLVTADPAKLKNADTILPFTGENHAFTSNAGDKMIDGYRERGWLSEKNVTVLKKNVFQNESGEIVINAPENILILDTLRTAGGFAPAGKKIETRAVTIEILDTDATVWVSSLDDKPIATSKRLLITHLTDLQNTEIRYADPKRQVLQSWGKLPHLVRNGKATVTLRLNDASKAKVYSVATSGKRVGEIASISTETALTIPVSVSANGKARMMYEVEVGK